MRIERFKYGIDEKIWNSFLNISKNSTFLFNRAYMDYHKNRFIDHSLLIYNDKGNLMACFPANETDDFSISSHSGLTYGAFILNKDLKLPKIMDIYKEILKYYSKNGFGELIYKSFPRIYNKIPSDEIDYCLFLSNAKLFRRDTTLVINQQYPIKYSGNIRREASKAQKSGIYIREENDFEQFWDEVITPYMQIKFGVKPVHSLSEIQLLKNSFPGSIKLFVAYNKNGKQLAGTVIFEINNVAHCQYISSTEEGRNSGALNYLHTELINNIYKDKVFFDFGTVNENNGRELNHGLLAWKERMGGRTISHDFFKIETKKYYKI